MTNKYTYIDEAEVWVCNDCGRFAPKKEDVKAFHGATFSKFEEDELFYLQTRGISKKEAGFLLINGFCQEIMDLIKVKELKKVLKKVLKGYLE